MLQFSLPVNCLILTENPAFKHWKEMFSNTCLSPGESGSSWSALWYGKNEGDRQVKSRSRRYRCSTRNYSKQVRKRGENEQTQERTAENRQNKEVLHYRFQLCSPMFLQDTGKSKQHRTSKYRDPGKISSVLKQETLIMSPRQFYEDKTL